MKMERKTILITGNALRSRWLPETGHFGIAGKSRDFRALIDMHNFDATPHTSAYNAPRTEKAATTMPVKKQIEAITRVHCLERALFR